jgi:VanZ family protein
MPEVQSPECEVGSAATLWLPVAAYMALIFGLSSISNPPATPEHADKLLHALLYSGLGALVARALGGGWHKFGPGAIIAAACFGAIYGASDELHQYVNPPRNVEGLDVLADTIGAAAGAVVLYAWGIIRGRDGL